MLSTIREKVKKFLGETIEAREAEGEIRVIGIEQVDDRWIAEAEVAERNFTLPGYHLFEKKRYVVALNSDLDILSYKQVKETEEKAEKEK